MAKKGNELIPFGSSDLFNGERQGVFQQGFDKLGRPYEKNWITMVFSLNKRN
jgi:hypothetical protein